MSQVDSRNSSAAKRARTDGGRREDDWTCPSCGNVNFSFRTTCNMRNCTQPRPADHNPKSAAKPMQAPQGYSSAAPYLGSGAPSSIYMGVPPYGSSLFNGTSIPPYDVPFSGGSAYPYNYGNRISGGNPYRPLHFSGPAPYSSGSLMGNGGMYGMTPLMDRYGFGLSMGSAMGPRPGFFPEDNSQKKGGDGTRDNDWACPKCGNVNFSFRTVCNMRKCNTPKPGSQVARLGRNTKPDMPEGSWKCEECGNLNYPFRTKCNRQNCGAEKPSEINNTSPEAADANDQVSCEICELGMSLCYLKLYMSFFLLCRCNKFSKCLTWHFVCKELLLMETVTVDTIRFPFSFINRSCSVYLFTFYFYF
ncbi:ranBP2-type zinc finger protein At1g67325-like isoform X2 [Olea europaea var. sylvestris]|uniref:ranBP2-type zinc finger protein At1g67325-like isoform X2 n=2 Tax=Olea europaea var. sylvestris TaxID=158386 RepID=UPI000C1D5D1E|nr:ranBP2-type zinc finger protein At1g67325-like isoform X2 [Olea europaea var. sylvestris]